MGDYARAEAIYRRCLEIDEAKLGLDHPDVATDLNNLAYLYDRMDRVDEAKSLYERCLRIYESALGPNHAMVATALNNLANLYLSNLDYAKAEPLYQRALEIREKTLSSEHPHFVDILNNLAVLHMNMGRDEHAADEFDRERRIVRRHVARVLPVLEVQQQLAFIRRTDEKNFQLALSFGRLHASEPKWTELSAGWLINGKSVVQASLAERTLLSRDNDNTHLQHDVGELMQIRTQLASLCLVVPKAGEELAHLDHVERLGKQERELARQVSLAAGLATQDDPWVQTQSVREALPEDAVLIEFARFRPDRIRSRRGESHWHPAHYVAWVIPPASAGDIRVIDLGEADEIDLAVKTARVSIESSASGGAGVEGEAAAEKLALAPLSALARLVLDPLTPAIGGAEEVVLCPDSQLWLAPWAALPLSDGRYAVERWRLRYVTSGRDLLLAPKADVAKHYPSTRAMVFADPDYDLDNQAKEAAVQAVLQGQSIRAVESAELPRSEAAALQAKRLPGTAQEARLIAPSLERLAQAPPTLYTGKQALEDVLKVVTSPQVLVLSTHGFYLPSAFAGGDHPLDNPLLRCGLLLAGCNTPAGGSPVDDGIVTGMEIVGCDLRGTDLVVLSACQTGVGEVQNGEGVAGLRQAFQLAGAKVVVSTLWRIPDAETASLMGGFFSELAKGRGNAEALRAAQVAEIKSRRTTNGAAHPFFWAAFTVTGN